MLRHILKANPKIIFFDIDGTLISHETPHLSDNLKQTFKELQNRGIQLWVSTGRHYQEIYKSKFSEEYDFDGYITSNGNYCYTAEKVIYANPIPVEDLLSADKYAKEMGYPLFYGMEKDAYVTGINDRVLALEKLFGFKFTISQDTEKLKNEPIYIIVTYCGQEKTKDIIAQMPHCKGTSWHDITTDIIQKDAGKGNGIRHILDYYHIDPEDTMAFGDGDNDIEMLDAVKIPVVMENAPEHVKKHGVYTTGTVETEGIIQALKHYGII